jgi:hypothetical protein
MTPKSGRMFCIPLRVAVVLNNRTRKQSLVGKWLVRSTSIKYGKSDTQGRMIALFLTPVGTRDGDKVVFAVRLGQTPHLTFPPINAPITIPQIHSNTEETCVDVSQRRACSGGGRESRQTIYAGVG